MNHSSKTPFKGAASIPPSKIEQAFASQLAVALDGSSHDLALAPGAAPDNQPA